MPELISYAQNREDVYINWLLGGKEKGFYVDVGANDPTVDSVTRFFYERGWTGIHIEPIRHHFEALLKERPRDTVLNIGISTEPGELIFHEFEGADGLSTLSSEMVEELSKLSSKRRDYQVTVRPLKDVFEEYLTGKNASVDFLKIDVEGYEYEVIASNDWNRYRPRLIVVEANHVKHQWRDILEDAKYTLLFFDGVNEYYGLSDQFDRESLLASYPEFVIGPTVLNKNQLEYAEWRVGVASEALLKEQQQIRDQEAARLQRRITELEQTVQFYEQQSTLSFMKRRAKAVHLRIRRKLLWLQVPHHQTVGVIPGPQSPDRLGQPVTPEAMSNLKRQDLLAFMPAIQGGASKGGLRKWFFAGLLAVYDAIVRLAKTAARPIARRARG